MRGYFPVDVRCKDSGLDYRVLYKSVGEPSAADLADAVKASLRRILFPDILVLVCIPSEMDQVKDLLKMDGNVSSALSRASNKVTVAVTALSEDGSFGKPTFVRNRRSRLHLLEDGNHRQIYDRGLVKAFSPDKVISRAPPGFIFLKPSGKRLRVFLRAEEALYDTEVVHFVACSILKAVSDREARCRSIEVFYIDSMAIGSVAYTLRDLYAEFFANGKRSRVVSFHSYSGMSDVDIPLPGTSFCLISASSSMDLHRRWRDKTKCHREEVITLVTFGEADGADLVLCQVPRPDGETDHEVESTSLRDLRIVGESFAADQIPPRTVLLTVPDHGLKGWPATAPKYSNAQVFSCCKASPGSGKSRALFVDAERLLAMKETLTFIDREIRGKTPISTRLIIYQEDTGSQALANHCRDLLMSLVDRKIPIYAASEVADAQFQRGDAVLVVAGVVGRGTQLLSLSRDLRSLHEGPRHYLGLFQCSAEIRDCEVLRKNLTFSATGEHIECSFMESLAIGIGTSKTFEDETMLMQSLGLDSLPGPLRERIRCIEGCFGISDGPFLEATNAESESLKLRPDFAFWRPSYDPRKCHGAGVFATVAAMLQRAREFQGFSREDARLSSDAFQQVVLDPENFARFNDGIIQAALLRAAYPHELNYASIPEASFRMCSILTQIFTMNHRKQGEASLEFAVALATKRLQLAANHKRQLIDTCSERVDAQNGWGSLLLRILGCESATRSDRPI